MPEYIGSRKVSDAYAGGKKVSKKYRGPNLYYSAYVKAGTSLYNFNGYATIPSVLNKLLGSNIQMVNTTKLGLSVPISKIQNGIELSFAPKPIAIDDYDLHLVQNYDVAGVTFNNPVKIPLTQLKDGYQYAHFRTTMQDFRNSDLTVSLKENSLVFTTSAPDNWYDWLPQHEMGTGLSYSDPTGFALALTSITAY